MTTRKTTKKGLRVVARRYRNEYLFGGRATVSCQSAASYERGLGPSTIIMFTVHEWSKMGGPPVPRGGLIEAVLRAAPASKAKKRGRVR